MAEMLEGLIENELGADHRQAQEYSAIIGGNPSRGARSPILWNATYQALEVPQLMLPLDVPSTNLGKS